MTSGNFKSVSLSSITVNREARQRHEITVESIHSLAESIKRIGLIHPIVIRMDGTLVSGETRLEAFRLLGYDSIPVQYVEDLDEQTLLAIELEENIKRTDISWQDQVSAVKRYHDLMKDVDENWTQTATADALGIDIKTVESKLAVAKEIEKGNSRVIDAPLFSTARGIVTRTNERARADEANLLLGEEKEEEKVLNANFLEWAPAYTGVPFNFIHCDFPYGIGADKFAQGASSSFGGYADTEEHYWNLVSCLIKNKERLLGESGHVVFWFSMRYYSETLATLSKEFWIDPYPLLWHKSDGKGTLPDPKRGPRRVYEVAFLCSHGDRKVVQSVANVASFPLGKREHMSEKSEDMLKHFFRMIVDGGTRMLDPTCGSGSALRAAEELGAASVLGLEINPEFALNAQRSLRKLK